MIEVITTTSGSVYEIDDDAKTWKRTQGETATTLRSDSGTFEARYIVFDCLQLWCLPLNPEISDAPRVITSTPIIFREWK